MTTLSREQQLIRAAEIRALLVSHLNNKDTPQTIGAIVEEIARPDIPQGDIAYALNRLKVNNLIQSYKDGKITVYASTDLNITPPKAEVAPVAAPAKALKAKKQEQPAQLVVDIVKATGRLRLNWQGMVIEIGVVDQ